MNAKTYQVEILTPCFCAGADQKKAEIRAPSIRGQLRWWFRALGGTYEQEKKVFGGVHGKDGAKASAVITRVKEFQRGSDWIPFRVNPNDPESYIWYFASVSSKKQRWTKDGNIPPESTFKLELSYRRNLDANLEGMLNDAVEAFLRFGCIGLRSGRGLGSLHCQNFDNDESSVKAAAVRLLSDKGFGVRWNEKAFSDFRSVLGEAGRILKEEFRRKHKSTTESALGWSIPKFRQASAVRFRVIRYDDQQYRLFIYEAPHQRVLAGQYTQIL